MPAPDLLGASRSRDPPAAYGREGAQPEIMDWWSGETLALILLVVFVIAAIVLTRSG